jgi:very-short-patch-repair endonuclease
VDRLLRIQGTRSERIAGIARFQRGRISRTQILAAGIAAVTIEHMIATGSLHPKHAGVYAVGHQTEVEFGAETAALLASREGAVLSYVSAGALWKICPPPRARTEVDVTVLDGRTRWTPGIRTHRTRRLERLDVRVHKHLPVTSPARTLLDLADVLRPRQLERALDEALALRLVRLAQVAQAIERLPGRRGARALAALVDPRRPSSRTLNDGEETLLGLIRAANLPEPQVNAPFGEFTIDFYWPEHKVALELDGYPYHSTRTAFERDRRKDAAFKAAGIDGNRVSYDQIECEPLAVIARVAQRLARAASS